MRRIMASSNSSSRRLLLSTAVLLAVLTAAAAAAPWYCVPGKAMPRPPLPSCRWYVASRTCGATPYLPVPVMKEMCCRELEAVVPECRCKALRTMMEEMSVVHGEQQECWQAQTEFAATVVTEQECGLRTIHGTNFCYALGAEY